MPGGKDPRLASVWFSRSPCCTPGGRTQPEDTETREENENYLVCLKGHGQNSDIRLLPLALGWTHDHFFTAYVRNYQLQANRDSEPYFNNVR